MHEFSLAQDVLHIVLEAARENQLRTVSEVRLEVGQASGVSVDALSYAWEYVRSTSELTAASQLQLDCPPATCSCSSCGFEGEIEGYLRICPKCRALGIRPHGGTQFMVTGISGD